jgi:hypothetical protein
MKLFFLFIILFALNSVSAFSQSENIINNDSLLKSYLEHTPTSVDTNADAVILQKKQRLRIEGEGAIRDFNTSETMCYKIIHKEALALAEITVPIVNELKQKDMEIYVCYLENGKLIKDKITKSDAIKETLVNGLKVYKFNITELKVGRILYYSYRFNSHLTISPLLDSYVPMSFYFQDKYPIITQDFEFSSPNDREYKVWVKNLVFDTIVAPNRTFEHIDRNAGKNTFALYHPGNLEVLQWEAHNLPKAESEFFVRNMSQNIMHIKILFDRGFTGSVKGFLGKSWKDGLQGSQFNFLQPNKNNLQGIDTFFNTQPLKRIDSIFKLPNRTAQDTLLAAKEVYAYVRDSIRTFYDDYGVVFGINYFRIIKSKKARVADKNILLTNLYQHMGLISRNVILSTDEPLDVNDFEPTKINYLICALVLGKEYYFLDPGYSFLPFGILAPKCYNGTAFVLNQNCYPLNISSSTYKDKNSTTYTITPKDSDNNFRVKLEEKYGKESSATERNFLNSDTVENRKIYSEYIKQLKYNFTLLDWNIKNEAYVDSPLVVNYNMDLSMEKAGSYTYFNPFIRKLQVNPLMDVARKYPIEFSLEPNRYYQLKLTLPPNWEIEEYPESKSINFKGDAITYGQNTLYDPIKNTFIMNYFFKNALYDFPASDYAELRSFYDRVVSEQAKQIVIKRKN